MGELCWSNTLDRISRPDSTLSTSLGKQIRAPASAQEQDRGQRAEWHLHLEDARYRRGKPETTATPSLNLESQVRASASPGRCWG